jgi:hypothetical protein
MKIQLLYFAGCPGHERLLPVLRRIAAEVGADGEIELQAVETLEEAERRRSLGLPSVRVDGEDIEPGAAARTDFGLKCRLYRSQGQGSGQPSEELIRAALSRAAG